MSTFIFAPSWADYPNRPKEQNTIDEFPTLANNSKDIQDNKKPNNNVWSNSHLLQKIQRPEDEEYVTDGELEGKKIELERLKALVPKRKPITLNRTKSTTPKPMKTRFNVPLARTAINNTMSSSSSSSTTSSSSSSNSNYKTFKVPTPKLFHQHISEEEKQRFIMFIKSWTSSGTKQNNTKTKPVVGYNVIGCNQSREQTYTYYSHFDTFSTLNDKPNGNVSYFYYNQFSTS
ncbi:unnamed protein product [Rhizopus stolonifer]